MMRGPARGQEVGEDLAGDVFGERNAVQARVRGDADQRAFELPHVVDDVLGDEAQHGVGDAVEVLGFGLLLQNCEARLELGRLDVGDQAPFEATAQPVLDRGDRLRRPVGGDHDLAAAAVQVVERVEELLLELLGALEELDVVDEQHVDLAVAALEAGHVLRAHRVDELVHHRLGRDVADALAREQLAHVVADRVQKVGLAEPGGPVDEQRVVRTGRALGHRHRGGVREAVRGADHELVERVAGIQPDVVSQAVPVVGSSARRASSAAATTTGGGRRATRA